MCDVLRSLCLHTSVCLSVCLSVPWRTHLKNNMSKLHVARYVTSGFVDDVMFPIMGSLAGATGNTCERRAERERIVVNVQHIRQVAPQCLTVVFNSSVSDDDMCGAAIG